jgi:hypothetical protein
VRRDRRGRRREEHVDQEQRYEQRESEFPSWYLAHPCLLYTHAPVGAASLARDGLPPRPGYCPSARRAGTKKPTTPMAIVGCTTSSARSRCPDTGRVSSLQVFDCPPASASPGEGCLRAGARRVALWDDRCEYSSHPPPYQRHGAGSLPALAECASPVAPCSADSCRASGGRRARPPRASPLGEGLRRAPQPHM